jgi:hypothetical protein
VPRDGAAIPRRAVIEASRARKEIKHTQMSTKTRGQSHEVVLALLRTGDARALLAAALIVVTLTLTVHTKARALEETGRAVIYVGAPSVSVSSAREAGAISRSYAGTVPLETLLALGFSEDRASRYVVDRALATVTDQSAGPEQSITAQAALEAGGVYLAQSGARPKEGAGTGTGEALVSAGPVRPELGDGTVIFAEDGPAASSPSKDQIPTPDGVDQAEVGPVSSDGGDLAYAGGPPNTVVAMHPGSISVDPIMFHQADPTSNEGATPAIVPSPNNTGDGENVPVTDSQVEPEPGPVSAEEQVPTALDDDPMATYPSVEVPAGDPTDDGNDLAVVPGASHPVEDAANDPIDATAPHRLPGQEFSTNPSAEEPDERSSAILLPAEPSAKEEIPPEAPRATEDESDSHESAILPTSPDERLPAPAETSTPDSEDRASGETTMGIPVSQEQSAEGFEDDAREQVFTTVVKDEPDQHVTVAGGEGQNETLRRSPEPAQDGGHPRLETAESTDSTETPSETTSERKMSSAGGAPRENWPPDQRNNRASREGLASELETNDPQSANPEADMPRGNRRDVPITVPPGERRDGHGKAPAEPEDDIEDGESTHVEPEAKSRAPRENAPRHPRQPVVDAPETTSRQTPTLSKSGARRPNETLGEDPTWRATRKGEAYRDGAVGQARLQRPRQDRLAARRTIETFEPSRPEPENLGQGWRVSPATDGRVPGRAVGDRPPKSLATPGREEVLDLKPHGPGAGPLRSAEPGRNTTESVRKRAGTVRGARGGE